MVDDLTGKKLSGQAVGYWGRRPWVRIAAEHTVDKVMRWNMDKIMAMGLPFAVWRRADATLNGLTQCSCFKDTAKQADVPCLSCYGTGSIPGYLKFGTKTYWISSIDPGWVLTNLTLDKENRPFRLMLTPGQTTGTAVSGAIALDVTRKIGPWEFKSDGFVRDGGSNSTIVVEYSVDNAATWNLLSQLNTVLPTTTIRFRVTMTRTAANIKTPMFEMIRCRFQTVPDIRGEIAEPVIRVIPAWDKTAEYKTTYGDRKDVAGKRFWTLPLYFFDSSMTRETQLSRVADDVFVEVRYGGSIGFRYALLEFDFSDTFGQFTRQEFALRQFSGLPGQMQGEFAYRVF
jgi:hypothetical protein